MTTQELRELERQAIADALSDYTPVVRVTKFVSTSNGRGRPRRKPREVVLVHLDAYGAGWIAWYNDGRHHLDEVAELAFPYSRDALQELCRLVENR